MERSKKSCCRGYKLVLMDINMPVMNGIDAAKFVKQKAEAGEIPPTTIVALSAEELRVDEEEYFYNEVGFASYVMKPMDKVAFLKLMKRYGVI